MTTTPRSYQDACAAAYALDLVGERWALLVVRELILGPKRFTDLRAGLPGISANVLTQRLTELEGSGIVQRRKLPPPASAWTYELTPLGQDLEPVIIALGRWAVQAPGLLRDVPMSVDAVVLSLRAMFLPDAAEGVRVHLALRFGEDGFDTRVEDGAFHIARGTAERPEAVVTIAEPRAIPGLLYMRQPLEDLVAAGVLGVEGDRGAIGRFVGCFPKLH